MSSRNLQFLSRRGLAALLLIAGIAAQPGCVALMAGAAAGAGAVAYIRGELQADIERRYEVVERAANRAIADLQFVKVNEKKDAMVAIILARTAEDTKVQIRISRVSDTMTKVQIRVGVFGSETLSRAVLDKIKAEL